MSNPSDELKEANRDLTLAIKKTVYEIREERRAAQETDKKLKPFSNSRMARNSLIDWRYLSQICSYDPKKPEKAEKSMHMISVGVLYQLAKALEIDILEFVKRINSNLEYPEELLY